MSTPEEREEWRRLAEVGGLRLELYPLSAMPQEIARNESLLREAVPALLDEVARLEAEVAILRATPDGKMAALFDEQVAENNRWSRECEALRAWVARAREAFAMALGEMDYHRVGEHNSARLAISAVLADAPKEKP